MQTKYKTQITTASFYILLSMLTLSSCKKLIEVEPPITSTTGASVFTQDPTAIAALTGIYTRLSQAVSSGSFATGGNSSISLYCGLSADELILFSGISSTDKKAYLYKNALFANATTGTPGSENWGSIYSYIFTCNDAIEGLDASSTLTPAIKNQLLGEAKFIRAFCYFYLVNLYGDVPLVTSTDYKVNAVLSRSSKTQVYQQIILDLKDAEEMLSGLYLDKSLLAGTSERVRPTKWAASALLARAYLYTNEPNNYALAENRATAVISNTSSFGPLPTLNNTFLKTSNEAIWQLQPVNTGWNTEDARLFVLTGAPSSSKPVYLSSSLLNSFELNDQRKVSWVNSRTVGSTTYFYPNKYKIATSGAPVTEYLMVLRLAEQYLIRAEARAQLNNISGAQTDLNVIRSRAGLPNTTANDKPSLLTAILHEKQVELFTEWGHRWLDLKRTSNIDAVMTIVTPLKANGAAWQSYQQLYPLPADQLLKNINLIQNPGYQ